MYLYIARYQLSMTERIAQIAHLSDRKKGRVKRDRCRDRHSEQNINLWDGEAAIHQEEELGVWTGDAKGVVYRLLEK